MTDSDDDDFSDSSASLQPARGNSDSANTNTATNNPTDLQAKKKRRAKEVSRKVSANHQLKIKKVKADAMSNLRTLFVVAEHEFCPIELIKNDDGLGKEFDDQSQGSVHSIHSFQSFTGAPQLIGTPQTNCSKPISGEEREKVY